MNEEQEIEKSQKEKTANEQNIKTETIDKNLVVSEAVKNICDNCKECIVEATNTETNETMLVKSKYCQDGDGYIDVTLYDSNEKFIDSCKLKHPTDSCILPFNLVVNSEPDCGCL